MSVANDHCSNTGYKSYHWRSSHLPVFRRGRYWHAVRKQPTADCTGEVWEGPPAPEWHICGAWHEFGRPQPRTGVGVFVPRVLRVGPGSWAQSTLLYAMRAAQLEERRVVQTAGHESRCHRQLTLPRDGVDEIAGRRVEGKHASGEHVAIGDQQAASKGVQQTWRNVEMNTWKFVRASCGHI